VVYGRNLLGGAENDAQDILAVVELDRSMVSEHDAALLNRFYEALNVGDVDAMLELCDQEVEVYMPPNVVAALPPRGHRDVGEYLHGWFDSWDAYRPQPEDFIRAGDQLVALVNLRARGKGSRFEIEEQVADVFEVAGGKISKLRLYVQRDTALDLAKAG
jgi:ketosteroid isomerase-like protein